MDYALAFLRAVLPEHGYYAAWTNLGGGRSYNRFFQTIEELAWHIATEDAAGRTVYHACSTFIDTRSRRQDNVWGARSLWLDIDAGKPDSPYATAVDAAEALLRFAQHVSLPRPILCGSGYGIHGYWPLRGSLDQTDWLELASALKAAARVHGLHADPSRTTDLASVLRTPGTHNRKLEAVRLVECGQLEGPYDVELFDFLVRYSSGDGVVRSYPDRADRMAQSPLTQALIVEPDYAPVYVDDVADQCAQVARLRATRGNIPEPEWYAILGVLAFCEDGYDKAHEWSSGYAGYTAEETDWKFDRAGALTGATTCAKLEGVHADGCRGCALRGLINSPIAASRRSDMGQRFNAGSAHPAHAPLLRTETTSSEVSVLPPVPSPFAWTKFNQLVCNSEKNNGDAEPILVSQHPIFMVGIGTGEVRSDKFAYHFRQYLPHCGWLDIRVPAGRLFGPAGASDLAENGANIHDHKTFLHYVRLEADAYHAREKLKMHFDQCGWKDDFSEFLVGDALYTTEGVREGVTVSSELKTRAQWLGPQEGNLASWTNAANALFAVGGEAQSFALACSFAAPLMRLQATDEGGAVVNLLSRGSGTGKTTTLAAISTAWGMKQGLSLTNIDTRVSKAITLGVLGNLPVVYDELGNRDPQVIRDFITTFTNGRDKMRGAQDGTINHTQAAWQTLMVTASNISIHDMLSHTGGSDALAYRVLEFQCKLPEGVTPAAGDRLRIAMEKNAGWAGDAFIDYLMSPGVLPWARQALEQWTAELWAKAGNRPEHRFWMRTLGAVLVAGKIVNQAEILAFDPNRIVNWALDQLNSVGTDSMPANKVQVSIETLGEFLSEHVDCVLVVRRAHQQGVKTRDLPLTKPTRRALMRYELEGQRLMISERALRDWLLKKEVGSRELIADLEAIHLVTNRRRHATITAGTDIIGSQQAVVEIDANHPAVSGALGVITRTDMAVIQDNEVTA